MWRTPIFGPLSAESSFSMPSGHTSLAFHTATFLTLTYPKWYVAAPAYMWAGATGYSRAYLGVHYPSDIAFGGCLRRGECLGRLVFAAGICSGDGTRISMIPFDDFMIFPFGVFSPQIYADLAAR